MKSTAQRSRFTSVIAAAAIVFVLGGLLAARLLAREGSPGRAANATVPAPGAASLDILEIPCWSCPYARDWPLRFRTDLDLLAPLGTGSGNAAEFFVLFEKNRGPRFDEATAFMERRNEVPGRDDLGKVVAADDPLLLEAEAWCDQAEMRFYPDLLPLEGIDTRITNLLVMLTMARSWWARGVAAEDPVQGLEDCRRAIRLGRLLRQEDVILINDLFGLACIHIGARGVYEIAQRSGNGDLALLTSVILGEVAPQRLYTSQRITTVDLSPYVHRSKDEAWSLGVPDTKIDALIEMVTASPDKRFRGEALLGTHVVVHLGTPEQQQRMRGVLDGIVAAGDPVAAPFARWCRDTEPSDELMSGYREKWE